jgi:hypothetical protein
MCAICSQCHATMSGMIIKRYVSNKVISCITQSSQWIEWHRTTIGSVLFITYTYDTISFIVKYSMASQRITMQRWTPFNRQHIDLYAVGITAKSHNRMLNLEVWSPPRYHLSKGCSHDEWCIIMSSERRYSQLHPIETLCHISIIHSVISEDGYYLVCGCSLL